MRRNVLAFLGFMLMVVFLGCDMGNGNIISQERTVEGFNGVKLEGVANINVYPGENYRVIVKTDSNLMDRVLTTVSGNILHISQKSGPFNATELTIDVYMPEIKSIILSGTGNLKVFNGNSSELSISKSGTGNIDAQDFQVQDVTINQSGTGNSKIWATNNLNGSLSGTGNILYKGSPTINVNKTGVGNIRPL
jgi:hypothetical protein